MFKGKVNEADFDDPSFDYIVALRQPARICFGSGLQRSTSIIGSQLSPFQKRVVGELNELGPGQYRVEDVKGAICEQLNKVRSKAGVGGLASKAQRFKEKYVRTPSPGRYNLKTRWGQMEQSKTPLGGRSKIRQLLINSFPGPGTYDFDMNKCRRTRFKYNLGNPTMIPCVEMHCVPIPVDRCHKCDSLCEGDYWHKDHSLFLCQLCWNEEKRTREIYSSKELKRFKKMRNCSFMHSHEETHAAIRILSQHQINKKIRIENYLDLYMKCDIPLK